MRFPVRSAGVKSNLLAPYDLIHNNQRVVLDADGSYIEDKANGERIILTWSGCSPVFEVEVMQPLPEDRKCIDDMDKSTNPKSFVPSQNTPGGSSSSGNTNAPATAASSSKPFRRQALPKL